MGVALTVSIVLLASPFLRGQVDELKSEVVRSIDRQQADLVRMADAIWRHAETALQETRSSDLLARHAEANGFSVTRGVAELPTAFLATFGSGHPVIGVMGEFDALPGISQKAQSTQEPLEPGAAGHGCGHNLFGPASLGAAIALKERIEAGQLQGTIRFYGTPAEESVGGKLYMVRAGLFEDVDVALAWHPSNEIRSDTEGSQALVDFVVEFRGQAAHAAFDPWNGRSAQDGLEIFTFALNLMREHVRPTVRMHYAVTHGAKVPNVVPDYARLWCWLRDSKHAQVDLLLERVRDIATGAALAAGVQSELKVQSGDYEMLVNFRGQRMVHDNLTWLGPLEFNEQEQKFAKEIQRATGKPETGLKPIAEPFLEQPGDPQGGSTDVADVSWVTPTLHLSVTTAPAETSWHAWPVVACGGMSIGHKGMNYAAKALAASMVDLFTDVALRAEIRAEFEQKTENTHYRGYIPDGPPPIPVGSK